MLCSFSALPSQLCQSAVHIHSRETGKLFTGSCREENIMVFSPVSAERRQWKEKREEIEAHIKELLPSVKGGNNREAC